jgi:hypothetical protein
MEEQKYYIKISPEVIKNKIAHVIYTASTETVLEPDLTCCDFTAFTPVQIVTTGMTDVLLSMQQILSGGTDGISILTGLTIPILITQTIDDIGYYSTFDGAIIQKDVVTNFVYSAITGANSNVYYVYNTSDTLLKSFLGFTKFFIDWGDGTPVAEITNINMVSHSYPIADSQYVISVSGASPWGTTVVERTIKVPYTDGDITNPNGEVFFIPQMGSWSATPISYDYIFTGDSNPNISDYIGSSFTSIPFLVTGFTKSSLNDLSGYGMNKFKLNTQISGSSNVVGTYWGPDVSNTYVAYTINGVDYYDYKNGQTLYVVSSSGLTNDWLVLSGITKNEALLNVIDAPQIESNVFIERGKVSVFEKIQRLGEVNSVGSLTNYGYKLFKVTKY